MEAKAIVSHHRDFGRRSTVHRIYLPEEFNQAEKDLELVKISNGMSEWEIHDCEIYNFKNHSFHLSGKKVKYNYDGQEYVGTIQDKVCVPLASGTNEYIPFDHYLIIPEGATSFDLVSPLMLKEIIHDALPQCPICSTLTSMDNVKVCDKCENNLKNK